MSNRRVVGQQRRSRRLPRRAAAALVLAPLSIVSAFTVVALRSEEPVAIPDGIGAVEASIDRLRVMANKPEESVIGHSVQGRPITAYKVGTGPETVLVIGGLHTGAEEETIATVDHLLATTSASTLPSQLSIVFIPEANPDGVANGERVNANGVDLNRNWPTTDWREYATHSGEPVYAGSGGLSEPETAALYDLALTLRPVITLSYHGFAGVVDDNDTGLASELMQAYGESAGYEVIDHWADYSITGEMLQAFADVGLAAVDIELIANDRDSFEKNETAFHELIRALSTASPSS